MKINSLLITAAFAAVVCYQTSVHAYASQSYSLEQRVKQLEQINQTRSQLQSQMSMQIIALEKQVRELRGIIEEHDYKLNQIQERQRDLYRDIDNRFNGLNASQQSGSATVPTSLPVNQPENSSAGSSTQTSSTLAAAQANNQPAAQSVNARAEFETAFKLVREKNYAAATTELNAFLKRHPNSNFSDNALFWVAQVYYVQGDLQQADKHFLKLTTDYPKSTKISSALLKMADIKVKQQQWSQAKDLYNQVLTKYSGAPQDLARKGLQGIQQAGH